VPRVLVRRPSPSLADGELTHVERQPVDPELALEQWQGYVSALAALGWDPIELAPADDQPDGVFVEDAVVFFGDVAVLTSPGAESRRGELATVETGLVSLGIEPRRIERPGTLDGGDVLKVGSTVYVGLGSRTNEEGIRQLAAIVEPLGHEIVTVPVSRALHLKSAVTALPDGTVIGYPPLVDDPSVFAEYLAVPEAHGTAVVVLDDETVLMSASAPKTARLLAARGLEVVIVPITEFEKLEGCVTCLSVRIRDAD